MSVKGNISNSPNGVIGPIKADINVYHGVESDSAKVTIDNRRKEIKVDVKEDFLDNKQDKLTAGANITIDENNVISATGGGSGSSVIPNPEVIGTEPLLNSVQIDGDKFRIGGSGGNVNIEAGTGISITGDETKTISVNEDVAMKTDIPSLDGYATETWVNNKGYLTSVSWNDVFDKPTFATVATTGSYNDLKDKPDTPTQIQSDWAQENDIEVDYIKNKPDIEDIISEEQSRAIVVETELETKIEKVEGNLRHLDSELSGVAFSGSYYDLTDKPDSVSGINDGTNWTSLTIGNDTYGLASGGSDATITIVDSNYVVIGQFDLNEANNKTIKLPNYALYTNISGNAITITTSDGATIGSWNITDNSNTTITLPDYSTFSGDYNDLTNKPILATVATTGSYNDLTDKPTIPTVSGTNDGTNWTSLNINNENKIIPNCKVETKDYSDDWDGKAWTGIDSAFEAHDIWTDGENIYYSCNTSRYGLDSPAQFVLDKNTSTWLIKNWMGYNDFKGEFIWTDGENIYYSHAKTPTSNPGYNYILDKTTSTWTTKTWTGLNNFDGSYIWSDGDNTYYSKGSNQYVLDKENSTWTAKIWTGLTDFDREYIWTDSKNIYYSSGSNQYVLDKSTSTWTTKTWEGLTSFSGSNIWTNGENIYYSYYSSYTPDKNWQYVLDKANSTWSEKNWSGFTNIVGNYIWTDGTNSYYSANSIQYVLDKETSTWSKKTWAGINSFTIMVDGQFPTIWTDGENIYSSIGAKQYILDKTTSTWATKTWSGLTSFDGRFIWTDGDNVYISMYSHSQGSYVHYVLDKETSTWSTKTWTGFTDFTGTFVWTDGSNIYYSSGSDQYVLDKSTSTWTAKTWEGLTNFYGNYIWTDGKNIYYSYLTYSQNQQYVLDKASSTWTPKTWNDFTGPRGEYVWTDGKNIYYSYITTHYVLDKSTGNWSIKTWNGLEGRFDGDHVWTDGENIYYSYQVHHYQLKHAYDVVEILDKVAISGSYNDLKDIPIPSAPTVAGTYTLQVVVDNDGNPTYQWIINS